jgi:hypothetical protein
MIRPERRRCSFLDHAPVFALSSLRLMYVWASVVNLQPIPEVYNLFDQVLLLQDSYLAYSGPRESEYCVSLPLSSLVWHKLVKL